MINAQSSGTVVPDKETAEFLDKLRHFRDGLPVSQQKAFNGTMAGAAAAFRLSKDVPVDREAESFAKAMISFRDGLPQGQRDSFTSLATAGALTWGILDGRSPEGEVAPVYFWHALLPAIAIIATGVVLVADELTEDDEEVLIPEFDFT